MKPYDFLSTEKYKEVISLHEKFTTFGIIVTIPLFLCGLGVWQMFRTITRTIRVVFASCRCITILTFFLVWFATVLDKEGETYFSVIGNIWVVCYEIPNELDKY